jgi:Clp amino terminal domain, pathogenicity island component
MTTPWSEGPQLPRHVVERAVQHASEFGRSVAGDDLFLLALTELPDDSPTRRALRAAGLDTTRVLDEVRVSDDGPRDRGAGVTFSPAYYSMHGRAEGFAACLGDGSIQPEHVTLALLWDPMSASCQLLWRLGLRRERILEALKAFGVPVPSAALPAQREVTFGEPEPFAPEDVRVVVDHLLHNIPPGTAWGWNYAGDHAWAVAEATVNLRTLIAEVTAR